MILITNLPRNVRCPGPVSVRTRSKNSRPKLRYIGDIYTKYLWVLDPGLHVDKDPVSNIHFCRIIRRPTYVPSSITWAGLLRAHPFGSQAYWRDNSKSGYVDSGTRKVVAAAVIRLDYVVRLPTYRTVYR